MVPSQAASSVASRAQLPPFSDRDELVTPGWVTAVCRGGPALTRSGRMPTAAEIKASDDPSLCPEGIALLYKFDVLGRNVALADTRRFAATFRDHKVVPNGNRFAHARLMDDKNVQPAQNERWLNVSSARDVTATIAVVGKTQDAEHESHWVWQRQSRAGPTVDARMDRSYPSPDPG